MIRVNFGISLLDEYVVNIQLVSPSLASLFFGILPAEQFNIVRM